MRRPLPQDEILSIDRDDDTFDEGTETNTREFRFTDFEVSNDSPIDRRIRYNLGE